MRQTMRRWVERGAWLVAGFMLAGGVAAAQDTIQRLQGGALYGATLERTVTLVCTDAQGQPVASRPPPTTTLHIRYVNNAPATALAVTCR